MIWFVCLLKVGIDFCVWMFVEAELCPFTYKTSDVDMERENPKFSTVATLHLNTS